MQAPIPGTWHPTTNKWHDESQIIHFVKTGDSVAMCGRGRHRYFEDDYPGRATKIRRLTTLAGPVEPAGRQRCQACLNHAKAHARRRKATAEYFIELFNQLNPAERQQMGQAWPAHAREDDTADWWATIAPGFIDNMKEALKGRRKK